MEVLPTSAVGGSPKPDTTVSNGKQGSLTSAEYESQLQDIESMLAGGLSDASPVKSTERSAQHHMDSDTTSQEELPKKKKKRRLKGGGKRKLGKKKKPKKPKASSADGEIAKELAEARAEIEELRAEQEQNQAQREQPPSNGAVDAIDDFVVDDLDDEDRDRHLRDSDVGDDASIHTDDEGAPTGRGSARKQRRSAAIAQAELRERMKTERLKRESDTLRLERAAQQDQANAANEAIMSLDEELLQLRGRAQSLLRGPRGTGAARGGLSRLPLGFRAPAVPPAARRNWQTPAQVKSLGSAPGGSAGTDNPPGAGQEVSSSSSAAASSSSGSFLDFASGPSEEAAGTSHARPRPHGPLRRGRGASKMISFDSPDHEEDEGALEDEGHGQVDGEDEDEDGLEAKLAVSSHQSVSLFGGLHQQVLQVEGDRKLIQDQGPGLQRSASTLEEVVHQDSSDDEDDHRMLINPLRRHQALQKRQEEGSPKRKRSRSGMFSPLRNVAKLKGDQRKQFLASLRDTHNSIEADKAARMMGYASVVAHGVGKLRLKLQRRRAQRGAALVAAMEDGAAGEGVEAGQGAAAGSVAPSSSAAGESSVVASLQDDGEAGHLLGGTAQAGQEQTENASLTLSKSLEESHAVLGSSIESGKEAASRQLRPPVLGGDADDDDAVEEEMARASSSSPGLEAASRDDVAPATPSPTPATALLGMQQMEVSAVPSKLQAAASSPSNESPKASEIPSAAASQTAATLPTADLQPATVGPATTSPVAGAKRHAQAVPESEASPKKRARTGYAQVSRSERAGQSKGKKQTSLFARPVDQSQAENSSTGALSGGRGPAAEDVVEGTSEAESVAMESDQQETSGGDRAQQDEQDDLAGDSGEGEASGGPAALSRNAAYREAVLAEIRREKEVARARKRAGIALEDEAEEDEDEEEGGARHLIGAMGLQSGQDMKALAAERRKLEEAVEQRQALELEANLDAALDGIVDAVSDDEDDDVSHDFIAEQQRKQDKQELRRITHAMAEGYKRRSRQGLDRLEQRMQEAEAAEFEADEEGALAAAEIARQQRRAGATAVDADLVGEVEGSDDDADGDSQDGTPADDAAGDGQEEDDDYDVEEMLRRAQREQRRRLREENAPEADNNEAAVAMPARTIMSRGSSILALKQRNRQIATTIARRRELERQQQLQSLDKLEPREQQAMEAAEEADETDKQQQDFEHDEWMQEAAAMADELEAGVSSAVLPGAAKPSTDAASSSSTDSMGLLRNTGQSLPVRRQSSRSVAVAGGAVLEAPAESPVPLQGGVAQPTPDVLLKRSTSTLASHVEVFAMLANAKVEAKPTQHAESETRKSASSMAAESASEPQPASSKARKSSGSASSTKEDKPASNPLLKAFSRTVAPTAKPKADSLDSDSDADDADSADRFRRNASSSSVDAQDTGDGPLQYDDMVDLGAIGRGRVTKGRKPKSLGEIVRNRGNAAGRPPRRPARQSSADTAATEVTRKSSSSSGSAGEMPAGSSSSSARDGSEKPGELDSIQRLLREASDAGGSYSRSQFGGHIGGFGDSMSHAPSYSMHGSMHGDEGASRPGGFGRAGLGAAGAQDFLTSVSRQGDSSHALTGGRVEVRSQGRKFAFAAAASSKPVGIVPAGAKPPPRRPKPSSSLGLESILGMGRLN